MLRGNLQFYNICMGKVRPQTGLRGTFNSKIRFWGVAVKSFEQFGIASTLRKILRVEALWFDALIFLCW